MCGIAGIIGYGERDNFAQITKMIDVIEYRGPDGRGTTVFKSPCVALGHRRLSIIDISDLGSQPMSACGERYWVVFNGEIYNYLEIRRDLEAAGCVFRSHSDTEVLLHAYAHWGEKCLERFIGMFAFAIWDQQERVLFAARDRLGKKPFYYRHANGRLLFASEIKSILAVDTAPLEVDPTLIDAYMSFGYIPGEDTLLKGIKRLLPGHSLTLRNGNLKIEKYWDFDFGNQLDLGLDRHLQQLNELLTSSVDLRLRSDVPLGVFLSGGLDSSALVAMLSPGASKGLKTFSVAYDFGPKYDETPYAREVAARYQTDHHEIFITPKDFVDFIPKYVWHMDEPVTEAAAISLYYVSRLAREQVVVCLSGEGSDELFAGYDFYRYNLAMEGVRTFLGGSIAGSLAGMAKKICRSRKLEKYLSLVSLPLEKRYKGISSYEPDVKSKLYDSDFRQTALEGNDQVSSFLESLYAKSKSWDPLSRMLYFDTKTWLVDDLLIKADRMSMATSIELRVPFLDHRLVEYAAATPSRYKINGNSGKHLLKKLMQDRLPASIIDREKMGFPTPLEIMLRGELFGYARQTLLSPDTRIQRYFSHKRLEAMLGEHRNGTSDNHREIWQLIVLEQWHRQFAL